MITALILLGRYPEARVKSRSSEAIRKLLELGAKEARVLRDGHEVPVPAGELRIDDLVVVRPGEKIATDGVVEEGASAIDQSMLTGESLPVEVGTGSDVAGASAMMKPRPIELELGEAEVAAGYSSATCGARDDRLAFPQREASWYRLRRWRDR